MKELADTDEGYVITKRRGGSDATYRNQMARLIKRAKQKQWPRIFHNLRSSRQTELEDQFPSHVVNAWMGNSEKVGREHYLQVTDTHFANGASQGGGKIGGNGGEIGGQTKAVFRKAWKRNNRKPLKTR